MLPAHSNIAAFEHKEVDPNLTDFEAVLSSAENSDGMDRGYMKIFTRNKTTNRPNQLLKCTYCGRTYTKLFSVKAHVRMHRGQRPFHCHKCNHSFVQKCNLKRHLQNGCSIEWSQFATEKDAYSQNEKYWQLSTNKKAIVWNNSIAKDKLKSLAARCSDSLAQQQARKTEEVPYSLDIPPSASKSRGTDICLIN